MVDGATFREVRARLAAAAVVVATSTPTGLRGITVTTFTPVSLDPAQVLVCLARPSAAGEAIVSSGRFTANLLGSRQQFIADRFAGQGPAPDAAWSDIPHRLADGLPLLAGSSGWFACTIIDVRAAGDHDVVLASVLACGAGEGEPLVYWERDFWTLAPT